MLFPAELNLAELIEPSESYTYSSSADSMVAETPFLLRDLRQPDRGSIVHPHPYSQSHNLDWIERHQRRGVRSFQPNQYSPYPSTTPAYQLYDRQQHHGRALGFGANTPFNASNGLGHGGFQGSFSNSERFGSNGRPPNFQLGPITANFSAHASAEWMDRLPTSVLDDGVPVTDDGLLLLSSGIDTSATIQVTEQGYLQFQIGVGIDYYPDGRPGSGDREDNFVDIQVLPNSYANYSFGVGAATFSIYDRFARFRNRAYSYYSLDPLDYSDYQEHSLGLSVQVPVNDRLRADGGYEFGTLQSLGSGAEFLDRTSHNWFGSLTYSPDAVWEVGVQASTATFDYDLASRPDGSTLTYGVFGNLPLSEYSRLSATAGANRFSFDQVEGFADSDSLDSTYWSGSLENDLNDRYTHGIRLSRGASVGISSNFVESTQINYDAQWRIFDDTVITAGVGVQRGTESGGLLEEAIESTHYHLGVRHELTEYTAIGANYSAHRNQSDLTDRDYNQQRLQVYCTVDLNERLELRGSLQRWNVESQADRSSFTQNSATIGLTFYF